MNCRRISLIILGIGLLSGCAHHLNMAECQSTNWQQVGTNDGAAGRQQRDLSRAIEDCQKFNIAVNSSAYSKGWRNGAGKFCTPSYNQGLTAGQQGQAVSGINMRQGFCDQANLRLNTASYRNGFNIGIKSFCTPSQGKLIGQRGEPLPNVCPTNLATAFKRGWSKGITSFCNNTANAFVIGRDGKAYPFACTPNQYIAFKSEYDRGVNVRNRLNQINQQIANNEREIQARVMNYGLIRNGSSYTIGANRSPDANNALADVWAYRRRQEDLRSQLFQAQAVRP